MPSLTSELTQLPISNARFWIENIKGADKVILHPEQIRAYNTRSIEECAHIVNLENHPGLPAGNGLTGLIEKLQKTPEDKMFLEDGSPATEEFYQRVTANLNLQGLREGKKIIYGITLNRTVLKRKPTPHGLFSKSDNQEIDLWVDTAVYALEPLVILNTSSDGKWYLAQMYNYMGWIPAESVAIAKDKKTLFDYVNKEPFLTVTGSSIRTGHILEYEKHSKQLSMLELHMGVRIPTVDKHEIPATVNGQSPAGNYVVKLPIRDRQGNLDFAMALIPTTADVEPMYLPYTTGNIITQAFKMLGEGYSWAGKGEGRDCTAFILDIFRSMGLILPRDSGQQAKDAIGISHEMPESMSLRSREELLTYLKPGTVLYMPGHAVLYLGKISDRFYGIHDVFAINQVGRNGELIYNKLYGVHVTPLHWVTGSKDPSEQKVYMKNFYVAREFILPN